MNPIKKSYIIDWSGPYTIDSLEDHIDDRTDCFYLISGLQKHQRDQTRFNIVALPKGMYLEDLKMNFIRSMKYPGIARYGWVGLSTSHSEGIVII